VEKFFWESTVPGERSHTGMSSQSKNYSLVILNDRVVPAFAGIMRESVREKNFSDRELKVVVASPWGASESKATALGLLGCSELANEGMADVKL
jgi:hypothetical protein